MSDPVDDTVVFQSDDAARIYAGLMALVDAVNALKEVVVCVHDDVRQIAAAVSTDE